MPLIISTNTTSTTPPRPEKKSLDTTAIAVTPRPCPTPTQIEDVKHTTIRPLELGHLLMEMKIEYETERCQQITGNYCDDSSISSLSVAASERDGMIDEENIFVDDSVSHEESTDTDHDDEANRLKPLKRCSKTFCFVPTIHECPSPPAKRVRLN